MSAVRRVRVLINPKSGLWWSSTALQQAIQKHWDTDGIDLSYQYSKTAEDGQAKTRRAVEEGVDTLLVVGGDGMVNSIGSALIHTDVALGVIPAGSGNGFARHFGIPLTADKAVQTLKQADRMAIDVGTANGRPFFVTCSMAWDATIVRSFDRSPVRGILPYVFAAAYEFLEYRAKPFAVNLDGEDISFPEPLLFTVANLTQYGGGAKVAPKARPDDGLLELVVVSRKDAPRLLAQLPRLFDGTLDGMRVVYSKAFKSICVNRQEPGPIQVDGELVESPAEVKVEVIPHALNVLVPCS